MNDYLQRVNEAIVEGRRMDAFADRWSCLCVRNWQHGIHDPLTGDTILSRVESRRAKLRAGEVVPFRRARFQNGDVLLGFDLASWQAQGEIYLPKYFFGTPWLILAGTGHGKSVLETSASLNLAQTGVVTWQLSFYKDDLLGQLPRFQAAGLELAVLRAQDLKLNPLQAGPNEPRTHLTEVTARLSQHLYDLPPRADLLLHAFCHELYREFGIFDGQRERWPTLFRVYEKIRTAKGLNVPARDALLDRLGSFLERLSPRCGAWLKAWNPSDLAQHPILFLLRTTADDVRHFLVEFLLDHVFQRQIERGVVNRELELFIFVDDAQPLVNSHGSSALSGLDEKVGKIRGGGVSIAFLAQSLRGISPHLLPNINGWLMGRTVEHDVRMALGRNFGMNEVQLEFVRLSLGRGQFVGVIAEGDWHEPFLIEAMNVDLSHHVTEADVLESQRVLAALPVICDDDFRKWERHPVVELQPDASAPALSPSEKRLLDLVVAEPGKPAGYYTRKLSMNGKAARAARERLVQLGLLREHKLQLNRRGKPALVLEPLPAAVAGGGTPTEVI